MNKILSQALKKAVSEYSPQVKEVQKSNRPDLFSLNNETELFQNDKGIIIKIDPYGFREYDARWLYEKDINLAGIENLGKGLGTQIINRTKKNNPTVIVGHDYRSYSEEIKTALKKGLMSTGCNVDDVGLSLSPMVYFAQFNFCLLYTSPSPRD